MSFYESLGLLVFGSRLRRLSETFIAGVNSIYKAHHLHFDASWFPVFYILSRRHAVSIKDIAEELEVSHSAISQLLSSLRAKGLIRTRTADHDGRQKLVEFTAKGRKLQQQIEPIWHALVKAMEELTGEGCHSRTILQSVGEIEQGMDRLSVFERVEKYISDPST